MAKRTYKKKLNSKLTQTDESPKEPMVPQQMGDTFASGTNPTENDASMINWQEEIKKFWCKIKEHAKSSLKLIKQDRIRSGLAFDGIFKENFLRSANSKLCNAYEEFLKDETFFDQCIHNINTEKQDQVNQATESIDAPPEIIPNRIITRRQSQRNTHAEQQNKIIQATENINALPEIQPKRILTRRQSQRNVKPRHESPDFYYYPTKRSSTKNAKNTTEDSNAGENSNVNGMVESSKKQQRMGIDPKTKRKLPNISEELNASQHTAEVASKNMKRKVAAVGNRGPISIIDKAVISRGDKENMPPALSKTYRESNSKESKNSGSDNKRHSLIILDDFCDVLKSNAFNKNDNGDDGNNEPKRKTRRCAKRLMTMA